MWEIFRPYYLKWLYFPLVARPSYFSASWHFPPYTPSPDPAACPPDLLFFPMTDWHTRIQRTQHLARTFSACGHRCFYLSPHLGREFPRPFPFSRAPEFRRLEPRLVEAHVHLFREPVFHQRLLADDETACVAGALKSMLEAAGTRRLAQVVSFPLWLDAALDIRKAFGAPILYDCHDVLSGFHLVCPDLLDAEKALFRAADRVIFSSQPLLDANVAAHPELASKSVLIRNAVDQSWLRNPHLPAPAPHPPSIGYIGSLDFWFDAAAIEAAARRHPDWRFTLIGRIEDRRIRRLTELSNVEFLGEIPHAELPRHLAGFRAAVIPFLPSELTRAANPIKLYEYFSAGLPVAATRLPELEPFAPLVYLAGNTEDFIAQLERAVAENDPALRQERIRVASRETWQARAAEFSRVITEACG